MTDEKGGRPIVGVAAIIIRDGKVLFGKRKGGHGGGTWCPPGGKLEFNEEFDACLIREVREETGLEVVVDRFAALTNNIFIDEGVHSITIYFICSIRSGSPCVTEPDKFEEWKWFEWGKLPRPLFLPVQRLVEQKFDPFSSSQWPA